MTHTGANTVPDIVFVSWGGHWFGVPGSWADNVKRAGLERLTKPPLVSVAITSCTELSDGPLSGAQAD